MTNWSALIEMVGGGLLLALVATVFAFVYVRREFRSREGYLRAELFPFDEETRVFDLDEDRPGPDWEAIP